MLKKVISISNLGRFESYTPNGDTEWRKFTLIYAENGRGKTTFTVLLRSLADNNPSLVLGRATLGQSASPVIVLNSSSGVLRFSNGVWTGTAPGFLIFDSLFVQENVHEGDHVELDHRRNLFNVIVGATGQKLNSEISGLDEDIRKVTRQIKEKSDLLETKLLGDVRLSEFLTLAKDDKVESRIAVKRQEIAALRNAVEIAAGEELVRISIPSLPRSFVPLLGKTISSLSAEAAKRVEAHISRCRGDGVSNWISDGVTHISGDRCPFCGDSLDRNELVKAYDNYFDVAYRELKGEVPIVESEVESLFGETAGTTIRSIAAENGARWAFWKEYISGNSLSLDVAKLQERYATVLGTLNTLLKSKRLNPLEAILLPQSFQDTMAEIAQMVTLLADYNSSVDEINARIRQKKIDTAASDIDQKSKELDLLLLCKERHCATSDKLCSEYSSLLAKKEDLEAQKESKRKLLNAHNASVFGKYEKRINELLENFGAGFRIGNTKGEYPGGKPSSTFNLVINGTSVALGKSDSDLSKPSFRNTLSAGDKSALAFCFFVAQAEADPDLDKKIVVFDDPFTSQDSSRRTTTQSVIRGFVSKAVQVVVLSHEAYFLHGMTDGIQQSDCKALLFDRDGLKGTKIEAADLAKILQSDHFRNHSVLTKYRYDGVGDPKDVIRCIRPYLEHYLRVKFPDDCPCDEWLGDYLGKIDAAVPPSALCHATSERAELGQLNQYSKQHHHADGSLNPKVPIQKTELDAMVKRTLELVKRL
jgi:wobble nucleotide-excising tRNase